MAYTQEEWQWINSRFTEGCRFNYANEGWATIRLRGAYNNKDRIRAQFDNPSWDQNWSEHAMNAWYHNINSCTWPNGSPMIPFVENTGEPYNPILAKIASLDARFKAKSLPKCTQKVLPLPA